MYKNVHKNIPNLFICSVNTSYFWAQEIIFSWCE